MRIFSLLAGLAFLAACGTAPVVDYVVLTGKITNPQGDSASVTGTDFKQTFAVNADGTFADTLRNVTAGFYQFTHGEMTRMYLKPGFVLNLTLDTEQFDETVVYTGTTGAAENNYLAQKMLLNEQIEVSPSTYYAMEEADFLAASEKMKASFDSLLNSTTGLDADFAAIEKKESEYRYLYQLQTYPMYYVYLTKNEDAQFSEKVTGPLAKVDWDNEADFATSEYYKYMLNGHYAKELDSDSTLKAVMSELGVLKSVSIKNYLAQNLAYSMSPESPVLDGLYNGLLGLSTDEAFKTEITEKYNAVKKLSPGSPSPQFTYVSITGDTVSLSDFAGKYVYIDVWATWCGPCKREIPFMKEVAKEYEKSNIVFVGISIDRAADFDTWKAMVAEKEMTGVQVFADNDWSSDFVTAYVIDGIPRFILIDPQGNIVLASAPRPSDPELRTLLNEKLSAVAQN